MQPAIDSLDMVELVIALEELFEIEIPDREAETFGSPREIVNSLEGALGESPPNKEAAEVLKRIAKEEDRPELIRDLNGLWRRDQIAAIIRTIFRSIE